MSDALFWLALTVTTVATSMVSGIVGMAGGMILLFVMLVRLEPVIAIPLHGIVQFVSNASRAWFQRSAVRWSAVWRFALPLLPAGILGVYLARSIPSAVALLAVSVFVLGALWAPKIFAFLTAPGGKPETGVIWGGALIGFLSPIIGATGPLIGPFMLGLGLAPQAFIGTLAMCQVFQHGTKVFLFGVSGFDFLGYASRSLLLCVAAIVGTALGTRLLRHVNERSFKAVLRIVLTVLAVKTGMDGGLALVANAGR